MFRSKIEDCIQWETSTTQQVDLAFNIFFMLYFMLRVGILLFTLYLIIWLIKTLNSKIICD